MRILVTGGAGFQGSHMVEHLVATGHDVTMLNTPSRRASHNIDSFAGRVSIVWGSVTDAEIVEKTVRDQDVVVHLAARVSVDESIDSPMSFLSVNMLGTYNVLEAIRKHGARLILSSTCEVYGSAQPSPLNEHAELRPHSPYAASKAAADRLCFAYHKTYDLDVTIVRPCNVYGERQKSGSGGAVIPIFASRATRGLPLSVFGSGEQRREYIHVSDLVSGYDLIIRHSDLKGATVNLGTGETVSVREIAELISERADVPIHYQPARPAEVPGFELNSGFARSLGFRPVVRFWDGLVRYLDWVHKNIANMAEAEPDRA